MVSLSFSPKISSKNLLIAPVFFHKKKLTGIGVKGIDALIEERVKEKDFSGHEGETLARFPERSGMPSEIVFVSLGNGEKLTHAKVLSSLAKALRVAQHHKKQAISIFVPKQMNQFGQAIGETLEMTNYQPAKFKTGKEKSSLAKHAIKTCVLITRDKKLRESVKKGQTIGDTTNDVRDWVNAPPNVATPEFMEEKVREIGKQNGYKVTVLKKKELEKLGMGLLLAVNRGSAKEARLLIYEYRPAGSEKIQPIVLVGKGIIFDSGGYNLKPSGYIENMHLDMAGAAAVAGMGQLLTKLKIKHPVIGVMPITENCIDATATKPSEIVISYSGKTVEITNTDAEGRLVLADAIAYAVKQYKPRYVIDIATLTGACMVALGEQFAGVLGNDRELIKSLKKSGRATDDLLWELPLHPAFSKAMKGEISDLQNSEPGRYAGASKGAAFIKEFIGKAKWAHLDIAGPAYTTMPKAYEQKRATGFGLRLFAHFLEHLK
ncbi:MAG: leucyl aminopeptidase [Patescibacteria group bacterium]